MQRNAHPIATTSRTIARHANVAAASQLALFAALALAFIASHAHARERQLLDAGWKFRLGDDAATTQPVASQADFDDSAWRSVNLPHDWSIEGAPAADAPSGGAGGYFPTGVGWYRRTFAAPEAWRDQVTAIEFDGVYQHAEVWINGERVGAHHYGYTPFRFDLTPHLKFGAPNTIAVRVDNSAQPNCRWYSGSGIYRHVWLETTGKFRLDRDRLQVETTTLADDEASLVVRPGVAGDGAKFPDYLISVVLRDPAGEPVARGEGRDAISLKIDQPKLWTPDAPSLYSLVAHLIVDGQAIDRLTTPVGIRTVGVSARNGFELNGRPLKLVGACVHHDHGPLGAASFDRAEIRKVELLKAAGFNAVRTSHNPPAPAFLDACDRLGLLVVDEAFDGWAKKKTEHDYHEVFADDWRADLETFVRRDRNHPSVVMWSIGNEVYERGDESGVRIAAELAAAVRQLDATRPITAACNGLGSDDKWPGLDKFFEPLDVAGYNYELDRVVPDRRRLPRRVMMATESFPSEAFAAAAAADERPAMLGDFVWTGIDYLGEAGIGRVFPPREELRQHWQGEHFPWHGAACGDIDLTGWRKPVSHYRNIVWDRGEKLYAAVVAPTPDGRPWGVGLWALPPALSSWTWPGAEGRELEVLVFSRHDEVQLFLNDKFIGQAETGRDQEFRATFRVPYEPGELRATGVDLVEALPAGGRIEAEKFVLTTAGDAAQLRLTPDRSELAADGQDLAFVTVEIADAAGRWRPDAAVPVEYNLTGPGEIAGIGSGDVASLESYRANPRRTHQGRALVVVRTTDAPGEITLTVTSPGLDSKSITITTQEKP
jgi:beta-galactosidase